MAGLARDAELAAQIRHRLLVALVLEDKAQLLFHHTARFRGHKDVLRPPCPRSEPWGLPPTPSRNFRLSTAHLQEKCFGKPDQSSPVFAVTFRAEDSQPKIWAPRPRNRNRAHHIAIWAVVVLTAANKTA